MAFDWDAQIRQQVNEFNRKMMMPTPSLGYAEGGVVSAPVFDVRQQPQIQIGSPAQTTPPISYADTGTIGLPPTTQPTITTGIPAYQQPSFPVVNLSQNPQGYAAGGMPMMPPSVGMPQHTGAIPGPVNMATGDDTMTPTKMGEYIIPVEAVMAIGKGMAPNSQLSPEDALAIGKQILDHQVMGLKRQMGDDEPVRNAGIPMQGMMDKEGDEEGYAEGGLIDDEKPAPVLGLAPTPLLKVSAGDTATGYGPAVEINSGNIDKYTAMKDARGVVANTPNNMPDLANTVKSMQNDGTGAKLSDAVVGANASPQVIMRGSLNDADAQAIKNRVDWSPGSQNVKQVGINAAYDQQVADAARVNKINEEQRLNQSAASRLVDMNRDYNLDQYSSSQKIGMAADAAATDAATLKGNKAAETKRLDKTPSSQPRLTKNVTQVDGKWFFLNDRGENTGMEAPDPYRGKDRPPGIPKPVGESKPVVQKLAPAQKRIDSLSKRMGELFAKEGDSPAYQKVRAQLNTVLRSTEDQKQNVDLAGMGVGLTPRQAGIPQSAQVVTPPTTVKTAPDQEFVNRYPSIAEAKNAWMAGAR